MNVDYETEVEDDILPMFRKGEVTNYIPGLYGILIKFFSYFTYLFTAYKFKVPHDS